MSEILYCIFSFVYPVENLQILICLLLLQIPQKDIEDNIVPDGDNLTAFELVKRYTEQKKGVKYNTRRCYRHVLNVLEKEDIGNKRIDKIKLSEAKEWFIKLQNNGKGYRTLLGIKSVIKPAFQIAVEDDLIRKNPFDFQFANIIINDSSTRSP